MHALVVGSGLLGLVTAYYLRRHGFEVTVVDRQAGPGRETSYANGGMLHASQANPWNEPGVLWRALRMLGREDSALLVRLRALPGMLGWGLAFVRHSEPARYARNFEKNARLARYSLATMEELRGTVGEGYGYAKQGTLKLFRTAAELAAAAGLCERLADLGVPYRAVDPGGAVAIEPALADVAPQLAGGLYFPADESGDAYAFCGLLAGHCRGMGVQFRFDTTVTGCLRQHDRVRAVATDTGTIAADLVVLAAGSYTPQLAQTAGLRVPVMPVKGYSLSLPLAGWAAPPRVPVIDEHLHAAICPLGARLRVAGTAEFTGYDLRLTPGRIANLYALVEKIYPAFVPHLDRTRAEAWTGLRPMSSDGVGIMGRTAIRDLYLNTGHGPLGWTMAAGAGKLVADQIAGKQPELDLGPYELARFR